VETLGLELVAGRDFDPAFPSDTLAWVVNEATAAALGWTPKEAIGQGLTRISDDQPRLGSIVGVVANAHFSSLHQEMQPMVFGRLAQNQRYAPIRIRSEKTAEALAVIEKEWTAFEPGYPFRYFFMDSDYQKFYDREERLGSLYMYFTVLAILIACLGLYGLASYVTAQRTREIGLRKALGGRSGASSSSFRESSPSWCLSGAVWHFL
jgi:putative ABC transport system permease protein